MDNGVNSERVEIRLICLRCGEPMELSREQALRLAAGLQAAAAGLRVETDLEVRGQG